MTQAGPTSRERIAEAAFELISSRGMAGVTMSSIAERAGVARQTLYNHFADVEGIVLWAVDQYEAAGMEQLRQVIAATEGPAAQLEQLVRFSVALAGHGSHGVALETGMSPDAQQRLLDHKMTTRFLIAGVLEAGVKDQSFREDLDVPIAAALIQSMLGSASTIVDRPEELARAATELVRAVLGSVR